VEPGRIELPFKDDPAITSTVITKMSMQMSKQMSRRFIDTMVIKKYLSPPIVAFRHHKLQEKIKKHLEFRLKSLILVLYLHKMTMGIESPWQKNYLSQEQPENSQKTTRKFYYRDT